MRFARMRGVSGVSGEFGTCNGRSSPQAIGRCPGELVGQFRDRLAAGARGRTQLSVAAWASG